MKNYNFIKPVFVYFVSKYFEAQSLYEHVTGTKRVFTFLPKLYYSQYCSVYNRFHEVMITFIRVIRSTFSGVVQDSSTSNVIGIARLGAFAVRVHSPVGAISF
jgi:hypothetical protein